MSYLSYLLNQLTKLMLISSENHKFHMFHLFSILLKDVLWLRWLHYVYKYKHEFDTGRSELFFLCDAAQETGSRFTGSDSATRQQRMREWFGWEYSR